MFLNRPKLHITSGALVQLLLFRPVHHIFLLLLDDGNLQALLRRRALVLPFRLPERPREDALLYNLLDVVLRPLAFDPRGRFFAATAFSIEVLDQLAHAVESLLAGGAREVVDDAEQVILEAVQRAEFLRAAQGTLQRQGSHSAEEGGRCLHAIATKFLRNGPDH